MKRRTAPRRLAHQAVSGIALLAIVYATASHVKPVFVGQSRVVQRVFDEPALADSTRMIEAVVRSSPWLHAPFEVAVGSGQFATDRDAFARDLVGTGHLTMARATRIADAAVTRAYRERVPPALILGIMLTENDLFKPTARSRVGAVGLMQIMPNVWRPTLGKIFGNDLRDDATNVKYGVFVLRWVHDGMPEELGPGASYRTALLRYNGCVSRRNSASCRRYPDIVKRHVLRSASASCGGRDFETCVIQPLWLRRQLAAPDHVPLERMHGATGMVAD